MLSVVRGVSLLFTASILSRAEHGKYDFAIPTSMRLLLIYSHSYSSLLFTENDSATMLGTILLFFIYTIISFCQAMLPKFITNVRVQSVGLSMRSWGGDGTSALGVVGVKSNFSELVDNQSFYLLRNLCGGVCVLTFVVFTFPTFIPRGALVSSRFLFGGGVFRSNLFVLPVWQIHFYFS